MVPTVELPPTVLFTDQVTEVFVAPVTVAMNCCVWLTWALAAAGEIETCTPIGVVDPDGPPPPQPTATRDKLKRTRRKDQLRAES